MKTENVSLTSEDRQKLEKTLEKFKKESKKRWIGLAVMFLIAAVVIYFIDGGGPDTLSNLLWILGPAALVISLAFIGVTKFLGKKFTIDLEQNTKTVYEGALTHKYFTYGRSKFEQEDMINYELDKDAKVIKFTTKCPIENKTTSHRLKYDQDDSTGHIDRANKMEFQIDDDQIIVDLKHFALFEKGEKVKAECFSSSKQLIRIQSLDDPNKVVETETLKFDIYRT